MFRFGVRQVHGPLLGAPGPRILGVVEPAPDQRALVAGCGTPSDGRAGQTTGDWWPRSTRRPPSLRPADSGYPAWRWRWPRRRSVLRRQLLRPGAGQLLVVHFMTDPACWLAEMGRVTRPRWCGRRLRLGPGRRPPRCPPSGGRGSDRDPSAPGASPCSRRRPGEGHPPSCAPSPACTTSSPQRWPCVRP